MTYYPRITRLVVLIVLCIATVKGFAQIARDYTVTVNGYSFDPLETGPDADQNLLIDADLTNTGPRLVQFRGPLRRQDLTLLKEQYGLTLNRYFPNYTYLETLTAGQLRQLSGLDLVRWIGPYHPAYKLSPAIGENQFVTPARIREPGLVLIVLLHPGASLDAASASLDRLGAEILQTFPMDAPGRGDRIRIRVNGRDELPAVASLPLVEWIEEEGDISLDNGGVTSAIQSGGATTPVHDQGIQGQGQIVGLIDAMIDTSHCFFVDAASSIGPGHRKIIGLRSDSPSGFTSPVGCIPGHGTHTGGTIAGFSAGDANNGIAFRSRLTFGDLNDVIFSSGSGTKTFLQYLNAAAADGAIIHSNSWSDKATGAVNTYTTLSNDLDVFTWNNENHLVVVSSGNNIGGAPSPIRPPFSSINGLSVAASQEGNLNNVSTGALGPTFDNRIKPDIYAPGSNTTSAQAGTTCGTSNCSGSSMATPAVAGAAALVRQYYQEGFYPGGAPMPGQGFTPSGALLKATLLNASRDMTGMDAFGSTTTLNGYPSNLEGWGNLVLDDALFFTGDATDLVVWDVRHADGLLTAEQQTHNVEIATNGQPIKITLTWTGPPPAAANFGAPVINDLDLTVTDPNGTVYNGNDFTNAGVSRANSTTTDAVNNVEMVLVNTPAPGNWSITVEGTAVNQGNPGQGYALVVTGDTPALPVPTGTQNTIVALTTVPGTNPTGPPSSVDAQELIDSLGKYVDTVSYEGAELDPVYYSVSLGNPLANYLATDSNPLIEMAEDVIAQLLAADANAFDRGTTDVTDDIDRLIILLNDQNFTGDWATTGNWPYELPGGLTRPISVSVSSVRNDADKRLSHAIAHQFGMVDLYNHPGVTFAQPHVDNWGIMANLNRVQPIAWSKERATWMSSHDANSIQYIPRPAAGSTTTLTIPLNWMAETNTDNPRSIAIGLTPGAANLEDERVFYWLEARDPGRGLYDDGLPAGPGVLLYYVNENIAQGEGPVRIVDAGLTTPATLDDAIFGTGTIPTPGGTGLDMEVLAPTAAEAYRISINYTPPATTNDVNIRVGTPFYTSPDIWVDSQIDGFDVESGRSPADRGNDPIAGEDNRIYFQVSNPGPGDAFDVTVAVRISEPYHTVGGDADFNRFVAQKFYTKIDAGTTVTDYVVWRPPGEDEMHACIQVDIQEVFNDVNDYNNTAQQNTSVQESTTASPYETVVFDYSLTNPYDNQQLVYFRLEGLPEGWAHSMPQPKRLLAANERFEGQLTVTPPDDAEVCTSHEMLVTSWFPKGNTIIPYGGTVLRVNLRNRTTLTADTRLSRCDDKPNLSAARFNDQQMIADNAPECIQMTTVGCTNPAQPNTELVIRYQKPNGDPVYRTVVTDAEGCYSDTYVVTEGGEWKVSAHYPGSDCAGESDTRRTPVSVPIPIDPNGGVITEGGKRRFFVSAHAGSTHPLGELDGIADANIYAAADLTYFFSDRLGLSLTAGLAQMTRDSSTAAPTQRFLHFSSNVELNFPRTASFKPFLRAGPGYYWDKDENWTPGVNAGLGGKAKLASDLSLTAGLDVHLLGSNDREISTRFLTMSLGLLFK